MNTVEDNLEHEGWGISGFIMLVLAEIVLMTAWLAGLNIQDQIILLGGMFASICYIYIAFIQGLEVTKYLTRGIQPYFYNIKARKFAIGTIIGMWFLLVPVVKIFTCQMKDK